ncbi:MAG: hypothetical protein IIW48_08880 [Clostridia bacterium]|nr:hypothetical protein [Clostridia bacterium]
MDKSPILGLHLTPEAETTKLFKEFRLELAGDTEDSNMIIIDNAIKALIERLDALETTPITWGMLKNGFNNSSSS